MTEKLDDLTMPQMMHEYALQSAKTAIDVYFCEGLTTEDYSLSYQILNQALLYIQNKRGVTSE